ncbi:MAG TPA: tyrosine-type recombinase/integrase [Ferruginibacter sp.]|nr:tyrosine-type recombinase/integrase [Ferruginibacter sp.]
MKTKEYYMTKLFDRFLKDSYKGKRLKANGNRIKHQTIRNYEYVLSYLVMFEQKQQAPIRIRVFKGNNKREFLTEKKYWAKFYQDFTSFLYKEKNCYDNYVGMITKTIRVFFGYLNRELGIVTGDFYKSFYVCQEEIPIITLMPEQLNFLINDNQFKHSLSRPLEKARNIFIFGCTVGLRISDLFVTKFSDIEYTGGCYYLPVKTIKTASRVRIKLPGYAMDIIREFRKSAKGRKTIFPPVPPTRFNNQIKSLAELAGWTHQISKTRNKRGRSEETLFSETGRAYRFCDLVSSHTMRITAITTMLMLGMKEHVVKQISGHTNDSKSFYRYVNFVQSYVDNEMDRVFEELGKIV